MTLFNVIGVKGSEDFFGTNIIFYLFQDADHDEL